MANGMESWLRARDQFLADVRGAMERATNEAGDLLLAEMRQLASLVDHDLEELRRMGHPYGWGKGRPANVPHSDWLVHRQNDDLYNGLSRQPAVLFNGRIESEFLSRAPHTWYVLLGTRKMRPRDFVTAAMIIQEQAINGVFESALKGLLDRAKGGYRVRVTRLPHDIYPVQLPRR